MFNKVRRFYKIGKRLFNAFKRYKWKFSLIIVLGFLAGLSGAFGIGTLIPLFYLLTGEKAEGFDFITETLRTTLDFFNIPFTLLSLILLAIILFIIKGVIQFSAKYLNQKISADYESGLRARLFKTTLQASWSHLIEQKVGFVERILDRDIFVVSGVITQISNVILISTSFITYATVAFKISAPITVITSVFGAVLFLTFRPFLNKIKNLSQSIGEYEKKMSHFINESIIGSKIIKTSAVEEKVANQGKSYFQKYRNDRLKMVFYQQSISSSFEPLSFAFIALLMLFYHTSPSFQIASFAVIIYLIQKIFTFIQSGQNLMHDMVTTIPYIQSVTRFRKDNILNQELNDGTEFQFKERIEFKNLHFSYNKGKEVLSGISFVIKKGEMLGLIGPSGSGKTTIADLLMRLFSSGAGEITIDGKNSADINLRSWRKNIGYMPQETFLLNDTIENNIKFYDKSLSKEEVIEAAKMANIYDFIEELPEGINAYIGERGIKISAGQRQRIALARVLVQKPQILILDEATSALDNQSELMIQKTIENLKGKTTILVIAHRLSTIMNSDRLLILENGKIVEEGTPQELLSKQDSHFYKVYHINS